MPDRACDRILVNLRAATMVQGGVPYGEIADAAIALAGDRIAWIGREEDMPGGHENTERIDLGGRLATPGLIDCHTHLVFAGDRSREFELRLEGASYEEISKAGGGIRSTVEQVRRASEADLVAQSRPRLDALMASGVTTVEIKSGYGLDTENECKMLRAARRLGQDAGIDVITTFLGAHALPPEFAGRADDYIDLVCSEMIPAVAAERLADAVDAFCEGIGFTNAQTRRVFETARKHGLPVKLHAEQLSDLKGTVLAAEFGALSADHLEYLDDDGIAAMAVSGTVAVLLPGAFYFLRETKLPPVDALRAAGVPMAVASDCNPGTSPVTDMPVMLNMASTLFRLTPEESLAGATRNAALALGLADDRGTLAAGKRADIAVWDVAGPATLSYMIGGLRPERIFRAGKPVA
jgi:imidazolonepropionase